MIFNKAKWWPSQSLTARLKADGKYQCAFVFGQLEGADHLAGIKIKGISIKMETTVVLLAVCCQAIWHGDSGEFSRKFFRSIPVTQTLHECRSAPIIIGNGEGLILLAAVDGRAQQIQAEEFSWR